MNKDNYPIGAVSTENDLLMMMLAGEVYKVYALGKSSVIRHYTKLRDLRKDSDGARVFTFSEQLSTYGEFSENCYLGDCNIGAHYNNHYLFRRIEDAQAYLEYVTRRNIGAMRENSLHHATNVGAL